PSCLAGSPPAALRWSRVAILRVGTSGYAYPAWRGGFYPDRLPAKEMLAFYSRELPTVEINHSFYRMPAERTLREWAAAVPAGFQVALKLNQKLTHVQPPPPSAPLLDP